ncbi:MAG: hypothetical protein NVS1B14_08820 [Vulcanimicrobiaceae bacterium]
MLTASMVADAMTPLIPGAGPPPTKMASVSFILQSLDLRGRNHARVKQNAPTDCCFGTFLCTRNGGAVADLHVYTEYVTLTTERRYEILDITEEVETVLSRSELWDGTILVSTMHITSSIFVNDHESGLWEDIQAWLERLAPACPDYHHHQTGEDNADAHLKRMIMGHQVLVPVTGGHLDLGGWERVHYGEFDGCRPKRILFKAMGLRASR